MSGCSLKTPTKKIRNFIGHQIGGGNLHLEKIIFDNCVFKHVRVLFENTHQKIRNFIGNQIGGGNMHLEKIIFDNCVFKHVWVLFEKPTKRF